MKNNDFSIVSLVKDGSGVEYVGPKIVKEFEIGQVTANTSFDETSTTFSFTIAMERLCINQMITAVFPTLMMWFLAYFTLFIKVDDFNERIMVAVTALLVLASLLSAINSSLPTTAYFKFIDLWFLWYTTNIFAISVFHIMLHMDENVKNGNSLSSNAKVRTLKRRNGGKMNAHHKKKMMNGWAKLIFALLMLLFNLVYFALELLVTQ